MKTIRFLASLPGLAVLAGQIIFATGCGPSKPAVDNFLAYVTNSSPSQAIAAGQFIAKLFAEQAAAHGLVSVKPLPPDAVALYFPDATGLNLSLSAQTRGEKSISISVIPVNMGKQDNTICQAVITTLQQSLKQNFGARLVELH